MNPTIGSSVVAESSHVHNSIDLAKPLKHQSPDSRRMSSIDAVLSRDSNPVEEHFSISRDYKQRIKLKS